MTERTSPCPLLARGEDADFFAITAVVLAGAPVRATALVASGSIRPGTSGEFAPMEWRVSLDRAVAYRADGNVSDKEKDRLTNLRL